MGWNLGRHADAHIPILLPFLMTEISGLRLLYFLLYRTGRLRPEAPISCSSYPQRTINFVSIVLDKANSLTKLGSYQPRLYRY